MNQTEYSVKFGRNMLTALTDAVSFPLESDGIFLTASLTPSACEACDPRVGARWSVPHQARGYSKNFSKNLATLVTSSRSRWYIRMPKLSYVWEVNSVVTCMCLNNVFIVISHIGETYAEDERSQARRGGYDPATYQWVGSYLPYLPIYYIYFPRKR